MIVRECYTEVVRGPDGSILLDRDGLPITLSGERWVEMPDVVTAEAQAVLDAAAASEAWNQSIRDQLTANDARYGVRAITEAMTGDSTRLDWLKAEQAALRAQFLGASDLKVQPDPAA